MIMAVMIMTAAIHLIAPYLAAAVAIAILVFVVTKTKTEDLKK